MINCLLKVNGVDRCQINQYVQEKRAIWVEGFTCEIWKCQFSKCQTTKCQFSEFPNIFSNMSKNDRKYKCTGSTNYFAIPCTKCQTTNANSSKCQV